MVFHETCKIIYLVGVYNLFILFVMNTYYLGLNAQNGRILEFYSFPANLNI